MAHKFKKGDKVRCIQGNGDVIKDKIYTVKTIDSKGDVYLEEFDNNIYVFCRWRFELVTVPTGKLSGYKLLKALPDLPANELFTRQADVNFPWASQRSTKGRNWSFSEVDVLQTEWFEPVYEPENTIIETVNGKRLEINKKLKRIILLDVLHEEKIPFAQAKRIISHIDSLLKPADSNWAHYTPSFVHFRYKFGCVELNLDDIRAIGKAMED